jgi:hypothetical protein
MPEARRKRRVFKGRERSLKYHVHSSWGGLQEENTNT